MAEKKPGNTDKVSPIQYLGQVRQEGRKVIWPTRQETITTTILVMIMVVITGAFFFVTDMVLRFLVEFFFNVFGSGN